MASTLEVKLRASAIATPALTSLLGGTGNNFRWFDMRAPQGSAFPLVEVLVISNIPSYSTIQRLATTLSRVQFTVWDTLAENARTVELAIQGWLDTANFMNTTGTNQRQANWIANRRQGANPNTEPLTFFRIVDAMIFNNELL